MKSLARRPNPTHTKLEAFEQKHKLGDGYHVVSYFRRTFSLWMFSTCRNSSVTATGICIGSVGKYVASYFSVCFCTVAVPLQLRLLRLRGIFWACRHKHGILPVIQHQ